MSSAIQLRGSERDRMTALVRVEVENARAAVMSPMSEVSRSREYFHDRLAGDEPMFEGASVIRVPFVKSSTRAIEAEIRSSLFDIDPLITASGMWPPWDHLEDNVTAFYNALFKLYTPLREVGRRVMRASLRDGAAVLKVCWKHEQRRISYWEDAPTGQVDPMTGEQVFEPTIADAVQTVFDAPWVDVLPIDRFGVIPSHTVNIEEATGCWAQYLVTGDFLLQQAAAGVFDKAAVGKILDVTSTIVAGVEDERFGVTAAPDAVIEEKDDAMREGMITEVWRFYSPTPSEPPQRWLFVIHEDTGLLLRAIPSPYWVDKWPFVVCRPYDSMIEGIFGDSVATAGGGHVQEAKTNLLRLAINMGLRAINPRVMIPMSALQYLKETLGPDASKMFLKDGAIIPMVDHILQSGKPLTQIDDTAGPSAWMGTYDIVGGEGEQDTGASDQRKGSTGGVAKTAREAMIIEASTKRLMGTMRENIAEAMVKVMKIIHGLVYQYQNTDSMQQLWAQCCEDAEAPMSVAMNGQYEFQANGMSAETNRMLRSEMATEQMMILTQEPNVWGVPERRYAALVKILKDKGERKPEAILGTLEEFMGAEQQRTMAMMQAQMGMPMEGGEGGTGVTPESVPMSTQGAPSSSVTGVQPAGDVVPNLQGQEEIYGNPTTA